MTTLERIGTISKEETRIIVEKSLKKDRRKARRNKRKIVSLMDKSVSEIAGFQRKKGSYDNLWDWRSLESV